MRRLLGTGLFGMLLSIQACTTTSPGEVTSRMSEQEAQVALGSDEVSPGDRVFLYRNECNASIEGGGRFGIGGPDSCRKVKVGEGVVTRNIDEKTSVVQIDPGSTFAADTLVEKADAEEGLAH